MRYGNENEENKLIEVVSIKFKNKGKSYFFSPNGLQIRSGEKVIVETSKGLEIADCCHGNHTVEDTAVVQPLRGVVRLATADDLRVAEINKKREKEAFVICEQKIAEHGLDMKLVDVECNFEGNKTTFFFTSNGRVDFRELVRDLAGIFRNRIELRQIGVRDETKMLGGIGICGRPYCCSQFLEDFQPVSTKMAKVQSLSLNPAKISGACGRLMCCLRYEQGAYEDLVKKVPKQSAFVETIDGYGTAVQVNLLRQTVKVRLDSDTDDSLHLYKANELCAVPGGRPQDGDARQGRDQSAELPLRHQPAGRIELRHPEDGRQRRPGPAAAERAEKSEVFQGHGRRPLRRDDLRGGPALSAGERPQADGHRQHRDQPQAVRPPADGLPDAVPHPGSHPGSPFSSPFSSPAILPSFRTSSHWLEVLV